MTKPTLLLFFGYGWAASSPFAYTLQRLTKYCHLGWVKNFNYLKDFLDHKTLSNNLLFDKIRNNEVTLDQWYDHATNKVHKLNCPTDLKPLEGFDLDEYIFNPVSIDRYIKYYKTLWNFVEPYGYKAVADYHLQLTSIFKYSSIIKEHFDFKSLLIVRDPIRRAFSHAISKPKELNLKILNNRVFGNLPVVDYVKKYKKLKSLIPDAQMIIMEELWEGDGSEKQKLSSYLNHPVEDLWPNLYSPDVGHHLTWDLDNIVCPNPCQVLCQSDAILTPEYYNKLRDKYSYIYDQWIDEFGSLPLHWGKPVDYDANAVSPQRHTQSMYPPLYPITNHLQDIYTH